MKFGDVSKKKEIKWVRMKAAYAVSEHARVEGIFLQWQADYGEIVASVVNSRDFLNSLVCLGVVS